MHTTTDSIVAGVMLVATLVFLYKLMTHDSE